MYAIVLSEIFRKDGTDRNVGVLNWRFLGSDKMLNCESIDAIPLVSFSTDKMSGSGTSTSRIPAIPVSLASTNNKSETCNVPPGDVGGSLNDIFSLSSIVLRAV